MVRLQGRLPGLGAAVSLKGRVARYDELVSIIGPKLAKVVSARMQGKRVTIGKKAGHVYVEYCRRKPYYDKMRRKLAAELLGCTPRYLKRLRALTDRIEREERAG
jgi:hypothetical protein